MPRRPASQAQTGQPRGTTTAAIRQALTDNPDKSTKEIAELLKEQGIVTTPNYIGGVKVQLNKKKGGKKRKGRGKAALATDAGAPALPKDAVSVGLLVKAKKLVHELGGVKEAKAALNALAQLLD